MRSDNNQQSCIVLSCNFVRDFSLSAWMVVAVRFSKKTAKKTAAKKPEICRVESALAIVGKH